MCVCVCVCVCVCPAGCVVLSGLCLLRPGGLRGSSPCLQEVCQPGARCKNTLYMIPPTHTRYATWLDTLHATHAAQHELNLVYTLNTYNCSLAMGPIRGRFRSGLLTALLHGHLWWSGLHPPNVSPPHTHTHTHWGMLGVYVCACVCICVCACKHLIWRV